MQDLLTARFDGRPPALALTPEGAAPADIQYMPPGRQTIVPTRDGRPVRVTVTVDEATAHALQASLDAATAAGDRPWFDYDHEDGRASGHPSRFYWAGDDAKKGGVRCEVAWTPVGAQALAAREYRHFSPAFLLDGHGRITGAPLNMGGLVNASAFRSRQPLWSKDVTPQCIMNEPTVAELQAKLTAALAETETLKAKLAEAGHKDDEITTLKAKIVDFETVVKAHRTDFAKGQVQAAITAQRLPPQATELHAKWQALIETDPKNADLLQAMPAVDPTRTVVKAGANSGTGKADPVSTADRWNRGPDARH